MSRSYSNFGCMKTIVLPVPDNSYTFKEYKEKYGIDLKEFVVFDGNYIMLDENKIKNSLILINDYHSATSGQIRLNTIVRTASSQVSSPNGARLALLAFFNEGENEYEGIAFYLPANIENPTIDSIRVTSSVI